MSFKGQSEFTKTIDMDKATREGLSKGVIETALNIKTEAKNLAPFNFGQLRDSIDTEDLSSSLTAKVGTNVEYAPYQEYGTRNMAPQPFMRPARMLAKNKSIAAVKLWLGINQIKAYVIRKVQKIL